MMKSLFFVLLLSTFALSSCNQPKITAMPPIKSNGTKVIAHRGFSAEAPENTLAAFKKAVAIGADYFELDVHTTKDGQLVVIHDNKVARTSSNSSTGKVNKMTLAELDSVRVGFRKKFGDTYKDEKIPTLKEALEIAQGSTTKVCIEIKVLNIEEKVLSLVKELKMQNQVIIFSFLYPTLAKVRQLDKNIPILYLIDHADKNTIDYAAIIHANAIGVGYATNPSADFIKYAHSKGIEIWKWTVNREKQMKELIKVGLDGMITNHPDRAIQIITNWK